MADPPRPKWRVTSLPFVHTGEGNRSRREVESFFLAFFDSRPPEAITVRRLVVCGTKCGTGPTQTLGDFSFELAERMRADPVVRAGSRLVLEAGLFEVAAASQFAGSVAIVRDPAADGRQDR